MKEINGPISVFMVKAEKVKKPLRGKATLFINEVSGALTLKDDAGAMHVLQDGSAVLDNLQFDPETLEADGVIVSGFTILDGSSAGIDAALASLATGKMHTFTCPDATNAVTVTLDTGTFDGTNNTATFDAGDTLIVIGIDGTDGVIITNAGVVLSDV